MSLTEDDQVIVPPEAIAFIEDKELEEGCAFIKFEVIEYFFEWLRKQPPTFKAAFLKQALKD